MTESAGNKRAGRVALAAFLAFTLASCLWAAGWGLPDGATAETSSPWAVDTIAPLGPLNEAYHRFSREGVENVIYPIFHYVVLAGAYAPYVAYALVSGGLKDPGPEFPFGAADPPGFFMQLTFLASIVGALMAAGCVLCVWLIARELFDLRTAFWAALLAILIPPLAYYGATSNLDVPYLFWTLLAMWQLIRAATSQRARNYALCGVFASLAVATKDQAAGFFVLFPVVVPWLLYRHARVQGRGATAVIGDPRLWIAAVAAIVAFVVANNLVLGFEGYRRHLQFADELYAANVATDAAGLLARQPALLAHSGVLLVQMVGVPFLLLAGFGLWLAFRERKCLSALLPLSVAGYYVAIIAPTFALSRYLLGVVLLLAPFAGRAIAAGVAASRGWRVAAVALAAAALLWQSALLLNLHGTLSRDSRYAMERWIRENVPAGATIESSTQARYLPRLSDSYRYSIIGNRFSATSYNLVGTDLTLEALHQRSPEYVMVLADSWLSGDPARVGEPAIRDYYEALFAGHAGYEVVAHFTTPTLLPYRQITAGTQPTSILLRRRS